MIAMRRRLACCSRDREISIDFDEQERSMTTYNGLASCILNNQSYENESGTSRGDGCLSDFFDDDNSTCSSSKEGFGSFSSKWLMKKKDEQSSDDSEPPESPHPVHVKENRPNAISASDVEAMKEKFAKLLLGEDITGGTKGVSTALALSNAITNLAASVFGELWKLEPLPEERKNKWRREMDWLLLPTNYMVELVPAKQNGINGGTMEIMTPKARADIQMNLPALQKLDSMLIETLDSMVNTEFWYSEVGSRAEGRTKTANQCKRWWLPLPQVPTSGLSDTARKKLFHHSNTVYQVFKAAKSINENVLSEMPVPSIIRDAIPKSGRANLSDELLKVLTTDLMTTEEMLNNLDLKSEQSALEAINKLKAAIFVWKERIAAQASGKSPVRKSWSFVKDPMSELEKTESLLDRAEALVYSLKTRYPNLPQAFLDSTKIQYGKDVGHSILEAYSRVLGNLALSILSRINDIFQEDASSNPSSPVAAADRCFQGMNVLTNLETLVHIPHSQHPLADDMSKVDEKRRESTASNNFESEFSFNSVNATPSRGGRVWCIGREACIGESP